MADPLSEIGNAVSSAGQQVGNGVNTFANTAGNWLNPGNFSNALQGFGNVLSGKLWAPQYNTPSMDQGQATNVMNYQNSLLAGTPQGYADKIMAGTQAANSVQSTGPGASQAQAESGGYGMPGMNDAIAARASKKWGQAQADLAHKSQFQGQIMQNQNMNVAASNATAMFSAQNAIDSKFNDMQIQSNAARYAAVSGLMRGAGSIAGAVYNQSQTPSVGDNNYPVGGTESVYNQGGSVTGQYDPYAGAGYGSNQSNVYDPYGGVGMGGQ